MDSPATLLVCSPDMDSEDLISSTARYRTPLQWVMPLSAMVGQEQIKRALLMLAVNPQLDGLLIRGEKGTGKSTLARGLARLLPPVLVNSGCPYGCPSDQHHIWCDDCREKSHEPEERRPGFVTLPLGATEDQLLGTLDLEHALKHGQKRYEPGLLARANLGVLYVDEVNLLDDHIVDLLLDVAASRVNVVAREGISICHPADFLLIGTMNPEEGELRPQLQDRFGTCVEIRRVEELDQRAEIVRRCLQFEADPSAFLAGWTVEERALSQLILEAQALLPTIKVDRSWHLAAARLSLDLDVDGHRADILLIKCAATLAALHGRDHLEPGDMEAAATFVYPHRLRRRPFEEESVTADELASRASQVLRSRDGDGRKPPPPSQPEAEKKSPENEDD